VHPIGFSLSSISNYKDGNSAYETDAIFENNLDQIDAVCERAAFWASKLKNTLEKVNDLYDNPKDEKTIIAIYEKAMNEEIEKLTRKMQECIESKAQPYNKLSDKDFEIPEIYPPDDDATIDKLNGLIGEIYIENPIIDGKEIRCAYYEGFSIDPNLTKPWLSGRLKHNIDGTVMARTDSPTELLRGMCIIYLFTR